MPIMPAWVNGVPRKKGIDPMKPVQRLWAAILTAAGVSSSQINTITTDSQNLKNALTTTDPTLQAKIAADEAAIVKDGGPSLPANSPGIGLPGMF